MDPSSGTRDWLPSVLILRGLCPILTEHATASCTALSNKPMYTNAFNPVQLRDILIVIKNFTHSLHSRYWRGFC